ncbi:hypothetical protein M407DRAFT_27714 [Tulasnella calospora MUT 4182]|uniref:Uncharacterized protein n=1 Tax=Tulasnella calospora MUT 4182 TaxID=1051891 RepID=A0A0C3QBY6_9AGAM|nr:hypothetical protein M407DRAFT_27714 [Tulasnella calospora MUT 4182]
MKLSPLYILPFAAIHSFASATAVPDLAPRNGTLAKRGGEVNYLCSCFRLNIAAGLPGYVASYMAWYSNSDNSLARQRPDSLSSEYRDWSNGGNTIKWEEKQQNIYFPDSGVTVQTHIDSDANKRAFTTWAGWAQRTSDWKTFNCYRDNSRIVFVWDPPVPDGSNLGISCSAEYWCV